MGCVSFNVTKVYFFIDIIQYFIHNFSFFLLGSYIFSLHYHLYDVTLGDIGITLIFTHSFVGNTVSFYSRALCLKLVISLSFSTRYLHMISLYPINAPPLIIINVKGKWDNSHFIKIYDETLYLSFMCGSINAASVLYFYLLRKKIL